MGAPFKKKVEGRHCATLAPLNSQPLLLLLMARKRVPRMKRIVPLKEARATMTQRSASVTEMAPVEQRGAFMTGKDASGEEQDP